MHGLPPAAIWLLGVHFIVGVTCLLFGLRLKRSFRWVLLVAGGLELSGVALLLAMALTGPH